MSYVGETLSNLLHQTAFFNLSVGNYVMIAVACVFLFLAIKKGFEPLLLVPIAFGMLLVNIYPDIIVSPEHSSNGVGGLLYYFYTLDEWSILPSLIFLGVGAMTDFGPLIANPISFLLGAAAQFGIFGAYFLAILLGFNDKAAAAVSIIGGADGPTSIFLAGKLGQTGLMGPIAVAAYSYMALVPIIQPPIMKLFTTKKERAIKMQNLRPVSKLERILFPVVVTIVVCTLLPPLQACHDSQKNQSPCCCQSHKMHCTKTCCCSLHLKKDPQHRTHWSGCTCPCRLYIFSFQVFHFFQEAQPYSLLLQQNMLQAFRRLRHLPQ